MASTAISLENNFASASTLGLLTRKAVYRNGLGSVLITKGYDANKKELIPKRYIKNTSLAYHFGNKTQNDTLFNIINYEKLDSAVSSIFENSHQTRAVLVLYKNQLIAERYAKGFTKESRILGWSMTKSILSTVFGIMQYQGKLSVQDRAPILEWEDRKSVV